MITISREDLYCLMQSAYSEALRNNTSMTQSEIDDAIAGHGEVVIDNMIDELN